MKKKEIEIDFELVKKGLTNNISSEEVIIFQLWLEQNEEHEIFYKKAQNYYQNGSVFRDDPQKPETAWKKLERELKELQNRKRRVRVLATTASIAAGIALLIGLFLLSPKEQPAIVMDNLVIMPGSEKATLILNNGESIEIDKNKEIILGNNQKISVKNNTIDYTASVLETRKVLFNTLIAKKGETFSLVLSDGTKVYLNSETTLHYPVQFSTKERKVELIGEAYFEVTHNAGKPFKVISNNQTIEVLGTSFNVHAYPNEEIIITTLVQGQVKVFDNRQPEMEELLAINQQATFRKDDGQIITREVNAQHYISWKEGYFFFQNQRFEDMMKTLSRWYDIDVVFENEIAKDLRFGGKLKRFDNLNKLLTLIEKTDEVCFEIQQGKVIVKE